MAPALLSALMTVPKRSTAFYPLGNCCIRCGCRRPRTARFGRRGSALPNHFRAGTIDVTHDDAGAVLRGNALAVWEILYPDDCPQSFEKLKLAWA